MILDLSTSTELQIHFDPVGSSEHIDAVAFEITILFSTSFQQAKIEIKERWFFHDSLNTFQQQLASLLLNNSSRATLLNMSDIPILTIERNANSILTQVQTSDTMGIGKLSLEVSSSCSEIAMLLEKLREYPKWW